MNPRDALRDSTYRADRASSGPRSVRLFVLRTRLASSRNGVYLIWRDCDWQGFARRGTRAALCPHGFPRTRGERGCRPADPSRRRCEVGVRKCRTDEGPMIGPDRGSPTLGMRPVGEVPAPITCANAATCHSQGGRTPLEGMARHRADVLREGSAHSRRSARDPRQSLAEFWGL